MRLISLPAQGRPPGAAAFWFNPEHIITAVPRVSDAGVRVTLFVRLKLLGLPETEHWLGDYGSADAADERWQRFLRDVQQDDGDAQ